MKTKKQTIVTKITVKGIVALCETKLRSATHASDKLASGKLKVAKFENAVATLLQELEALEATTTTVGGLSAISNAKVELANITAEAIASYEPQPKAGGLYRVASVVARTGNSVGSTAVATPARVIGVVGQAAGMATAVVGDAVYNVSARLDVEGKECFAGSARRNKAIQAWAADKSASHVERASVRKLARGEARETRKLARAEAREARLVARQAAVVNAAIAQQDEAELLPA